MELTIIQSLILGLIQGITEWLPISSSGMLTLALTNLFGVTSVEELMKTALFLHLGTFFAALIYFRIEVKKLILSLFNYKKQNIETKKTLNFLLTSTIISGILGFLLIQLLISFEDLFTLTGKTITFFVALLLLVTGLMQLKVKNSGLKKEGELDSTDGILLGLAQGFAALPGISRSGITVSTLLLKKFDDTTALKLSFLMSLPIVLMGNIILNLEDLAFTSTAIYGLLASFVFGLATIHALMKLSKKINFGWFVLIFAVLMFISLLF